MLEGSGDPIKRQSIFRNRSNNRRNSRERFDRLNNVGSDNGDKGSSSFFSGSGGPLERGNNVGGTVNNNSSDLSVLARIEMNGWSNNEAIRLMNERWAAALQSQSDLSLDVADRPVVYSSSEGGSVWGSSKLAYQASVMDFLAEVGLAIRRANTNKGNARLPSY